MNQSVQADNRDAYFRLQLDRISVVYYTRQRSHVPVVDIKNKM